MIVEGGRVVIFSGSCKSEVCKVLIHKVYSEGIFPVPITFHICKRELPAGSSIGFTEFSLPACLICSTGQLFNRTCISKLGMSCGIVPLIEQHIDGRNLRPCIHSHIISTRTHIWPFMFPVMTCEFQAFFFTIGMPWF